MLQLESVSKQFATKVLLKEASVHLRPGTRVGLVGPNGVGKTTLLRLVLGEQDVDDGRIRKRPRLRIGYLPQDLETIPGHTALDATHRGNYPEHDAKRILSGLGFTESDFSRPLSALSGGFRMRVALAHLLLSAPDILLLDEPTNHLDKATQRWFEDFLLKSSFTMLVISHDTAFLDRIATHIWEIRHQRIMESVGNYTKYVAWREAFEAAQAAAADRQDKEIGRVQKFVDRFRYQATKASQVQSRLKQLEKVKRIERTRDPKRVRFRFPIPSPSGRHALDLKSVAKAYGEIVVYRSLDFFVERGQRVALVGENGAGKSTVGKALAKHLGVRFIELDALIESDTNLVLGELFSLHGEAYYKRRAYDLLVKLLSDQLLEGRCDRLFNVGFRHHQFTPTASPMMSPMPWCSTRSAVRSSPVGSRLTIARAAPFRFAISGKPAAG